MGRCLLRGGPRCDVGAPGRLGPPERGSGHRKVQLGPEGAESVPMEMRREWRPVSGELTLTHKLLIAP